MRKWAILLSVVAPLLVSVGALCQSTVSREDPSAPLTMITKLGSRPIAGFSKGGGELLTITFQSMSVDLKKLQCFSVSYLVTIPQRFTVAVARRALVQEAGGAKADRGRSYFPIDNGSGTICQYEPRFSFTLEDETGLRYFISIGIPREKSDQYTLAETASHHYLIERTGKPNKLFRNNVGDYKLAFVNDEVLYPSPDTFLMTVITYYPKGECIEHMRCYFPPERAESW